MIYIYKICHSNQWHSILKNLLLAWFQDALKKKQQPPVSSSCTPSQATANNSTQQQNSNQSTAASSQSTTPKHVVVEHNTAQPTVYIHNQSADVSFLDINMKLS